MHSRASQWNRNVIGLYPPSYKRFFMKKIAMLFPYAPAYRELIYKKIDENLEVDWFFCGDAKRPLKLLDYSILKRCDLSMKEEKIVGPFHRYKGIKDLPLDGYDAIIVPTVTRCISLWWLVFKYGSCNKGPKIFYWTHGWYGRENTIERILKKLYYLKADGFLLYNKRSESIMRKMGYDERKLHVVYNSLDYDTQLPIRKELRPSNIYTNHFNNEYKNIVFIGRLRKSKKFELLLEAISILKRKGFNYNVTFIGDGEDKGNMEKQVNELGIVDQVWFYGSCFDEQKNAELIYNADLCVSPRNVGLTAIHVLMFGCPTITSDDFVHQGPEFEAITEGVTGSFFKAGDSDALADCIYNWFLSHDNDRETVRENCYKEIDMHWNPYYQINILKELFDYQ